MGWVRIDDNFPQHPKVVKVGPLGLAMQVAALCYCNKHLTDGFIPRQVVPMLLNFEGLSVRTWEAEFASGAEDVTWEMVVHDLIDAGLWEEVEGGYRIHDYLEYQPSREQVLREREAAKQRMARARSQKAASPDVLANNVERSGEVRANSGRSSSAPNPNPTIEEIPLDSIPPYGRDTVSIATTGSAAPDGASSPRRGPDPSHIQDPDSVDDPLDKLVLTAKKRWPPPAERNVPETLKWRKTLDAMLKVDRIKPEVVAKLIAVCPLESPDPWDFRRWARDQPTTEMRRRHKLSSAKEVKHLV